MARRRLNGYRFDTTIYLIEHKAAAVAMPTLTIQEWHDALVWLDSQFLIRLIAIDGRFAHVCLRHKVNGHADAM